MLRLGMALCTPRAIAPGMPTPPLWIVRAELVPVTSPAALIARLPALAIARRRRSVFERMSALFFISVHTRCPRPCANDWPRLPPSFWALESLLQQYPISSAEGLALMRLAEALLRVPDAETAIALTADQLGRADFDGAADSTLARLSSTAIAMSKHFLPESGHEPGLMAKLGAKTVVAATLRAVQLLGRQFVLGQTIGEGMKEATAARRKQPNLQFSYDMLGEGARTQADALRYQASYENAIAVIVNPDNPVSQLTLRQISDIYSGKINNWSQVGGEDRPIVRLSRETNSGVALCRPNCTPSRRSP